MFPRIFTLLLTTTALPVLAAETLSPTVVSNTAPVSTTTPARAATVKTEARTIDQSIALALKHPTLMSSEARRQQAQSNLSVAKANRWFTLSGDAEAGVQHYDDEGNSGSAGVGAIGLSLNQPLIDGGRRRGAVHTAAEGLAAASENLAWQQRQRSYIAAQTHINLWLAQELVRNNADNVAQLENIVTEVRARLTHAESTVTELAEAESRLATARAIQAERITALGAAQASYLRDVGETATTVAAPGEGPQEEVGSYGLHPLVQAAQHAVEQAEGIYRQRKAGNWPTLDLRGRGSHNAFAGTTREEDASNAQLTLNLGYTFIDNGATRGEIAAAKAAKTEATSELENTKLEVEAARLNAEATSMEASRRVQESDRARAQTAKVIGSLTEEVKQGNRTLRDLLDARRDQLASANAWSQAYANRALSNYDLARWK